MPTSSVTVGSWGSFSVAHTTCPSSRSRQPTQLLRSVWAHQHARVPATASRPEVLVRGRQLPGDDRPTLQAYDLGDRGGLRPEDEVGARHGEDDRHTHHREALPTRPRPQRPTRRWCVEIDDCVVAGCVSAHVTRVLPDFAQGSPGRHPAAAMRPGTYL
ncbi:hypothetical protein BW733_07005 [Tessaracoccus flavescens]|uniref:Uncharacterized protein n=1 Tax=Tessaracoccus flavescens TaxID=399497 RepID=A0A1Q2CWX4_9ACTN|nr:hypothetical protein BW733_07005 [Tessaracoccus flavescens]